MKILQVAFLLLFNYLDSLPKLYYYMSFSHYDEDGARTSHRTHCCIGARRATHCATGDDR